MLIVLASSLRLHFPATGKNESYDLTGTDRQSLFLNESLKLVGYLKKYSPVELAKILGISDIYAVRYAGYYEEWSLKKSECPAVYLFDGDAYRKLKAKTLNKTQLGYLESSLRILSGLYGILKPMDLIQPYRLEMGAKLPDLKGYAMYEFWRKKITHGLNRIIKKEQRKVLINLAPKEYFRAIDSKKLKAQIITPVFLEERNHKGMMTSRQVKQARGAMARYAAIHNIQNPKDLKSFDEESYIFDEKLSNETQWIFRR